MLVKYATLWLFTLPLSPCNLYVLFTYHFQLIYSGLITSHSFFYRVVHNVLFNACMHVLCMYVKYTFVCIPHRDIYHSLSGMVRSITTIFQDNTDQYGMLCCRSGVKTRSNSRGPTAPRETVGPRTLSTFTPLQSYWNTKLSTGN